MGKVNGKPGNLGNAVCIKAFENEQNKTTAVSERCWEHLPQARLCSWLHMAASELASREMALLSKTQSVPEKGPSRNELLVISE